MTVAVAVVSLFGLKTHGAQAEYISAKRCELARLCGETAVEARRWRRDVYVTA